IGFSRVTSRAGPLYGDRPDSARFLLDTDRLLLGFSRSFQSKKLGRFVPLPLPLSGPLRIAPIVHSWQQTTGDRPWSWAPSQRLRADGGALQSIVLAAPPRWFGDRAGGHSRCPQDTPRFRPAGQVPEL